MFFTKQRIYKYNKLNFIRPEKDCVQCEVDYYYNYYYYDYYIYC